MPGANYESVGRGGSHDGAGGTGQEVLLHRGPRHPEEGGAPERTDGVLSGGFSFLELSLVLQLAQSFLRVLSEQGWSRSV